MRPISAARPQIDLCTKNPPRATTVKACQVIPRCQDNCCAGRVLAGADAGFVKRGGRVSKFVKRGGRMADIARKRAEFA